MSVGLRLPLSSRFWKTIGMGTPSGIGIIFIDVTSCLAACTERRPPEMPP